MQNVFLNFFSSILFYSFFNWDSLQQPLKGMELQEKEGQKNYSIQEICLGTTYS